MLTAFTDREGRETLADHIDVPDIYAAGRLDRDSEGLLLLARGTQLRGDLMRSDIGHPRTYLVQVEGIPDSAALNRLTNSVELKDGPTLPAIAELLDDPPDLPERTPPIRVRKTVPDRWIRLTLTEGRNRQVRRMTAAVGHPTLRLVREQIGPISIEGLRAGQWEVVGDETRTALAADLRRRRRDSPVRSDRGPRGSSSRSGRGRKRRGPRSPG